MDEIEEIRRKIDIVDLISNYLTLKKSGANYKAPCPFHQEKSPSFMVSPEKQIFKCFGCGKGGSIFDFIMEMEGMNFPESLEYLAQRAGVQLKKTKNTEEYKKEKDLKTKLYQINNLSSLVFHKLLLEHKIAISAREYLNNRGLNEKTIKEFMIGYAPANYILRDFLVKRGFTQNEIHQAGSPDQFKNRIIFPLTDVMGRVIAFTGRVLDPDIQPKYLNTPETVLFHKSRLIYGLDKAKQDIKLKGQAVLVEGQMDVVMSHQIDVKNVVACSGTALTPDHLEILKRYSNKIIFAFDQDTAGQEASKKSINLAIEKEMNAKMAILPKEFKDAGEVISKDAKIWQEAVEKPLSVIDWYFEKVFFKHLHDENWQKSQIEPTAEQKKEIARELLPIIKIIPDIIERAHYIQLLAKKISVSEKILESVINKTQNRPSTSGNKGQNQVDEVRNKGNKELNAEEILVGLLIKFPQFLDKVVVDLDYKDFITNSFPQEIYRFLQSCYTKNACSKDAKNCSSNQNLTQCLKNNFSSQTNEKIKILFLTQEEWQNDDPQEILKEILNLAEQIKSKKREKIKKEFAQKIRQAEDKHDRVEVKKLLQDFQKIISK